MNQKHILQSPDKDPQRLLNSEKGRLLLAKALYLTLTHQKLLPPGEVSNTELYDMDTLLHGCYEQYAKLLAQKARERKDKADAV